MAKWQFLYCSTRLALKGPWLQDNEAVTDRLSGEIGDSDYAEAFARSHVYANSVARAFRSEHMRDLSKRWREHNANKDLGSMTYQEFSFEADSIIERYLIENHPELGELEDESARSKAFVFWDPLKR